MLPSFRIRAAHMRSRIARKKPSTSVHTRERRMAWARVCQRWTVQQNWSKVLFSDETRYNLGVCDGQVRVWRQVGEELDPDCTVFRHPSSKNGIMFWGCIGIHGPGELVEVQGGIDRHRYIQLLEDNLRQSVGNIFGDEDEFFIFQQDNAPAHTARDTQQWFEEQDITVMNWPPYSPDLNIIENVWSYITTKLKANPPQNLQELRQQVFHHWAHLPEDYVHKLFQSLPRRVRSVLDRRGYPLKY